MIEFSLKNKDGPFIRFLREYNLAREHKQKNIEAACLSTISNENQVNSRFVNIKYVNDSEFIFFSNYQSQKAKDIESNNNVSLTFFWNLSNQQIRIKGNIKKLNPKISDAHWNLRDPRKNALAISSKQSQKIESFSSVKENFDRVFKEQNLTKRPEFWGGYSVKPDFFEFWEGNHSRLNKREVFSRKGTEWESYFLQP